MATFGFNKIGEFGECMFLFKINNFFELSDEIKNYFVDMKQTAMIKCATADADIGTERAAFEAFSEAFNFDSELPPKNKFNIIDI